MNKKTVLIIGGAGNIGSKVADNLWTMDYTIRVMTTNIAKGKNMNPSFEIIEGDVRDMESLQTAIKDVDAVVGIYQGEGNGASSPEKVDYHGTMNVLKTIAGSNIHFIYLTNIYVTRPENPLNSEGRILDWRNKAEQAVRNSKVPYTIIRPAWLTNNNSVSVRAEQGDKGDGKVSRAAVASVIANCVLNKNSYKKTFELYTGLSNHPINWTDFFSELITDN